MRNRALTDLFEPGSTLKPFTIAAALEAGMVRPDTVIQTAPGTLTIGRQHDHDAHPHGALTVEQVIQKSSNVGAAKIALSLPPETMWQMFSDAGLRHGAADGFPGRSRRAAAAVEDVEADRAGDDGLRPRHLGQPAPARARLHDLRPRRRADAGDAGQDRRRRRGPASRDHAEDRARRARTCWSSRCSPAAPRRRRR